MFDNEILYRIECSIENVVESKYQFILIGSYSDGSYKKNSDIDFLLYIDGKQSISYLQDVSLTINSLIKKAFNDTDASVKIFNDLAFENLYFNDFFRYYEYSKSYQIILDTLRKNIFNNNFKELTNKELEDNFYNSISIQYWWTIFSIVRQEDRMQLLIKKFSERIVRNISLLFEISSKDFDEKKLRIKASNYKFISERNHRNTFFLIEEYLDTFNHERINKSTFYINSLINKESIKDNVSKKLTNQLLNYVPKITKIN